MAKDCKKPKKSNKKKEFVDTRKVNSVTINFKKAEPEAKVPQYRTEGAAGADLTPSQSGTILKFSTKRIPTGLSVEIPKDHHGQIHSRSSLLMKRIVITGILDSDYRGNIDLIVTNNNPYEVEYSKDGEPMAQLIIIPNVQVKFSEVSRLSETSRKGGFGSTNIQSLTNHPVKLTFKGKINGKDCEFLVDSGADGIFCGKNKAAEAKMKLTTLKKNVTISTADGQEYPITEMAQGITYTIQGFKDTMDLYILPVDHDHILLGNHWLSKVNPKIDWRKKEAVVERNDKTYTLQVNKKEEADTKLNFLTDINDYTPEVDDLLYMVQREDIEDELGIDDEFYAMQREEVDDPELNTLLEKYSDVF